EHLLKAKRGHRRVPVAWRELYPLRLHHRSEELLCRSATIAPGSVTGRTSAHQWGRRRRKRFWQWSSHPRAATSTR
ncbi:unnamed protein product, partial [Ectocarpus sp. 13 AM-2016]